MNLELIKRYLQNYLDSVVTPRVNKKRENEGFEPVSFSVHSVLKGSFQPPIIHIFLDSEPMIKKSISLKPHAVMMMSEVEHDIADFLKYLSINYKTKVHWNKRPIFNNETLSADH